MILRFSKKFQLLFPRQSLHMIFQIMHICNWLKFKRLSKPVTINAYVRTVSLPNSCASAGEKCYLTGWGRTNIFTKTQFTNSSLFDNLVIYPDRLRAAGSLTQNVGQNSFQRPWSIRLQGNRTSNHQGKRLSKCLSRFNNEQNDVYWLLGRRKRFMQRWWRRSRRMSWRVARYCQLGL